MLAAAFGFAACGSGGGGSGGTGVGTGNAELTAMHYGRLVDVYGLRVRGSDSTIELFRTDVVIGLDIQDERDGQSRKADNEILYDFIGANPDTLQQRLLITRDIESPEFSKAFAALDDQLRLVTPGQFGDDVRARPFTVVPRNAAIRLTFSKELGITNDFFVERDSSGAITGIKNTIAVELLEIVGDPRDGNDLGDFRKIATRAIVRGNAIVIDPVLLGSEGLTYQTRNNASGMPASADQQGANIRLAVALEGPLAIPGLRKNTAGDITGKNNEADVSIVRDFRSGNSADDSPDISRGFIRDPLPPRIVGELVTYLAKVEDLNEFSQVITLFKAGIVHELDRGDVVRVVTDNASGPVAVTEIAVDPVDDLDKPAEQWVRAIVRRDPGLAGVDPSKRSDFPGFGDLNVLGEWLVANAPKSVVVAEFAAERLDSQGAVVPGDDAANFLTFSPSPLVLDATQATVPNDNVSPFAGAIVRFTKPVDMSTVRALDTFFFGIRDLLDRDGIDQFIKDRKIDPNAFRPAKFRTPHLVVANAFDEDGSQTSIRLQPAMGFYLDQKMRSDRGKKIADKDYKYFLHLVGGSQGIRDLSGNSIDLQTIEAVQDDLVIPFALDVRETVGGKPLFSDNLVVSIPRRFANDDEDEQPSYYRDDEIQQPSAPINVKAYNLADVFGSVVYLADGKLSTRPTSRVTQYVDDLNQVPPPPQVQPSLSNPTVDDLNFCPFAIGNCNGGQQVATASAGVRFGQPIQNPLNPYGARLQTVWREIDLSLSRTDPFDFNLDVEQMYWAPFTGNPIVFDEFDKVTLFLGHSEFRPEPCVGTFSALPTMSASGLKTRFSDNYIQNKDTNGSFEGGPEMHPAYRDQILTIDPNLAFTEPNGVNRYMPLPEFQEPYFVYRDETMMYQGANATISADVNNSRRNINQGCGIPAYIISPYAGGRGRIVGLNQGNLQFTLGRWINSQNYSLNQKNQLERNTDGLVGHIALPLLADFWNHPDSPDLPNEDPFFASGANGWQIALAVQSSPSPNFRVYSGGGLVGSQPKWRDTDSNEWVIAAGGFTPTGGRTRPGDNSVYWMGVDFLKRTTVVTAGFVDIYNPHRVDPSKVNDPRLGPFFMDSSGNVSLPSGTLPRFDYSFEPLLTTLPGGTEVIPEFRAAGPVDPAPWLATEFNYEKPDAENFPLDPFKAGDAHIRKFDDRVVNSRSRNWWTYFYNRHVTDYTSDPNTLMDSEFTNRFSGSTESFLPQDVRYFNWRFVMRNNVKANPPVNPTLESFAVTYRFEKR